MNQARRHEIVQRHQQGASRRRLARERGIARGAVDRVSAQVQAQRDGPAAPRPVPRRRGSLLDAQEPLRRDLPARYPNLTGRRAREELRARGFRGQYTIVRQRLRSLRPRPPPAPVVRFEAGPGEQAQMDHGAYDVDFRREGRRRVYLFS